MLRMSVYMHSRFVENHPIRILEDGPLISEVVLSQRLGRHTVEPRFHPECRGAILTSEELRER
jgi:hypothetical protein